MRTIAATTWSEYRRHIEKDPALTRRFQVVQVREPDEARAITMMRGIALALEAHHGVQILDEAVEAAVRLSHRYLPARQLPDKSVSLLDTACARVAVSQHATPPEVDDARKRIEALNTELEVIARESAIGIDTTARHAAASAALQRETERLAELDARWRIEREMVKDILARRAQLRDGAPDADLAALREQQALLARHQGDVAADSAGRRSSRGRGGRAGLDRRARAEHAEERNRQRVAAERTARWPHHRPAARDADDRPAHADVARGVGQSGQAGRAYSCSPARPASARPRPRWRWPRCCTAASRT